MSEWILANMRGEVGWFFVLAQDFLLGTSSLYFFLVLILLLILMLYMILQNHLREIENLHDADVTHGSLTDQKILVNEAI